MEPRRQQLNTFEAMMEGLYDPEPSESESTHSVTRKVATFDDDGSDTIDGEIVVPGTPSGAKYIDIDTTGKNVLPMPWIVVLILNGYEVVKVNTRKIHNGLTPIMESVVNWIRLGMDEDKLPNGFSCVYTYDTSSGEIICMDYSKYVMSDATEEIVLNIALRNRGDLTLTWPLDLLGTATNVKTLNKLIRFTGYQLRRMG